MKVVCKKKKEKKDSGEHFPLLLFITQPKSLILCKFHFRCGSAVALLKLGMVGGATAGPQLAVVMMETGVSRIMFFFSRRMNRKLGTGFLPNKHLV